MKPDAVVWRGDPRLRQSSKEQQVLFQLIPWVNNPQAAYLFLLMCGATRPNFLLRALRPEDTESHGRRRGENVWSCLGQILGTPNAPAAAHTLSTLTLSAGGWRCARGDSLRMVRQRHTAIAERMVVRLEADDPSACFRSVRQCRQAVLDAGLEIPPTGRSWPTALHPAKRSQSSVNPRPNGNSGPLRSWKRSLCARWCGLR